MTYLVSLAEGVDREIRSQMQWLKEQGHDPKPWYEKMLKAMRSLQTQPTARRIVGRTQEEQAEVRYLYAARHYIFYIVDDHLPQVTIVHIVHSAKEHMPEDLGLEDF